MDNEKRILTNTDILELAVGVLDYEEENGMLHLYRCLREQIADYWKLSDNLGEWAGRTNGVRLDFVTDSSFFSFKVIVGKKYELFVNGVKEDHIELSSGDGFYKDLDISKGENRLTLIFPSHESGVITEVTLSKGAKARRYQHTFGKKIFFIGDSITQGWDTVSDSNSYAYQVSLRYDADTVIFGVGGAYFHESAVPSVDNYHPDIIISAFGANDFGRGEEALKKNMRAFLDKLVANYKDSKIIGLTPICGAGHKPSRSSFRLLIESIYDEYGIEYIDGAPLVSPELENFADRYHPNDKGYCEMADNLIPLLNKIIGVNT